MLGELMLSIISPSQRDLENADCIPYRGVRPFPRKLYPSLGRNMVKSEEKMIKFKGNIRHGNCSNRFYRKVVCGL